MPSPEIQKNNDGSAKEPNRPKSERSRILGQRIGDSHKKWIENQQDFLYEFIGTFRTLLAKRNQKVNEQSIFCFVLS